MKPLLSVPIAAMLLLLLSAHLLPKTLLAKPSTHAALIEIDSAIHPVSGRFLERGLEQAAQQGAQLVIIRLNTPGGLLDTTRNIVTAILESPIPVVVYVAPSGVHAASAGTFIVAAAQVAVMAPATNIGAASPVGASGQDLPDTVRSKATADASAFLRSIASKRGRNAAALEKTVFEAASYNEAEALEKGVIDFVAQDLNHLVTQLDGMVVEVPGGKTRLQTSGIVVVPIERSSVERFLDVIADPQVTFILLSAGGILIIVELLNFGLVVPGVLGAFALAMAFLGLGNLPVNWVAVGLIMLGLGLIYGELLAPGWGALGLSGGVSFLLGAFLLFTQFGAPAIPTPSLGVSLWLIAIVALVMAGYLVLSFRTIKESKRLEYRSSVLRLVGDAGFATTPLEPRGTVQIASELWTAESDSGDTIAAGEEVLVAEVDGLTLKVIKTTDIEGTG